MVNQHSTLRQALQYDPYHRELGEPNGDHGQSFVVSHQAAIAAQPGECALDHPAATQDFEPAIFVGSFDDFQLDRQPDKRTRELWASIASVSEELFQSGIFSQGPPAQSRS